MVFAGLIFGPGIFLCVVASPRDFFFFFFWGGGGLIFATIRLSPSLEIQSTRWN